MRFPSRRRGTRIGGNARRRLTFGSSNVGFWKFQECHSFAGRNDANSLATILRYFLRSSEGATAVEYAVTPGSILLITIAAIGVFGQKTSQAWSNSNNSLQQVQFGS